MGGGSRASANELREGARLRSRCSAWEVSAWYGEWTEVEIMIEIA